MGHTEVANATHKGSTRDIPRFLPCCRHGDEAAPAPTPSPRSRRRDIERGAYRLDISAHGITVIALAGGRVRKRSGAPS